MHRKFVGKDESGSSLDDLDDDSGDQDDLVLISERRAEHLDTHEIHRKLTPMPFSLVLQDSSHRNGDSFYRFPLFSDSSISRSTRRRAHLALNS